MGRVFSPEDVAQDRIPQIEHFNTAETTFLELADLAIERAGLISAVIYGSWASRVRPRRADRRSDFNGLLVYDGGETGFQACEDIISRTIDDTDDLVRVNVLSNSATELVHGRSSIDRFLGKHLENGDRITRGVDPATYIEYGDEDVHHILHNFLASQKDQLRHLGMSHNDNDMVEGLGCMLGTPVAVGRRVLQVIDELHGTNLCPADTTDKDTIADYSLEVFRQMKLDEHPRALLIEDAQYAMILQARLRGDATQGDYVEALMQMDKLVPSTVRWIDAVDAGLQSYLDVRFKPD